MSTTFSLTSRFRINLTLLAALVKPSCLLDLDIFNNRILNEDQRSLRSNNQCFCDDALLIKSCLALPPFAKYPCQYAAKKRARSEFKFKSNFQHIHRLCHSVATAPFNMDEDVRKNFQNALSFRLYIVTFSNASTNNRLLRQE